MSLEGVWTAAKRRPCNALSCIAGQDLGSPLVIREGAGSVKSLV
jgi:hypothetical protein